MTMISTVYFLTGSNLGDRKSFLKIAKQRLNELVGEMILESSIYESSPWGFVSDDAFLNQVLLYKTELTPDAILRTIHRIESENGRLRTSSGYSSRTLDIDILFYDSQIITTAELTIPHPRLHERRFSLMPLAEIAPDFIHPVLRVTVMNLLETCTDLETVKKI